MNSICRLIRFLVQVPFSKNSNQSVTPKFGILSNFIFEKIEKNAKIIGIYAKRKFTLL